MTSRAVVEGIVDRGGEKTKSGIPQGKDYYSLIISLKRSRVVGEAGFCGKGIEVEC
jgi:hypothetical protein